MALSCNQQRLDDPRQAADGVLEPGGVVVVVRRGGVGAAHLRGDAAGAEETEAVGDVMHAELEGQAALRPAAQRAGDALPGDAGHLRREGKGELPSGAGAGAGLAVIEAECALRRDGEAQRMALVPERNR